VPSSLSQYRDGCPRNMNDMPHKGISFMFRCIKGEGGGVPSPSSLQYPVEDREWHG